MNDPSLVHGPDLGNSVLCNPIPSTKARVQRCPLDRRPFAELRALAAVAICQGISLTFNSLVVLLKRLCPRSERIAGSAQTDPSPAFWVLGLGPFRELA